MEYITAKIKPDEAAVLKIRGMFENFGYKKYKMGKFEEYSLYAANKDFLAGDKVITFTDLDGRLMALKPDVTLSIIKNTKANMEGNEKLYYIENVYRESRESNNFIEIPQMGLEYMGNVDDKAITEVCLLAVNTLKTIDEDFILEISHMDFVVEFLKALNLRDEDYLHILKLIRNKNRDGIKKVAEKANVDEEKVNMLCQIPMLFGKPEKVFAAARQIVINEKMAAALVELEKILDGIRNENAAANVNLDLSMINDIDYYNGVVFRGYLKELGRMVLAGGQYDKAMAMFGKKVGAIGFALYLNEIARLNSIKDDCEIEVVLKYKEK